MAGRPSNRDERYIQVMDALVRCVARFGLDGASLSQVATEAGLTRPLIRHHLGNREAMIEALQEHVLQSFAKETENLVAALPEIGAGTALVDFLFSETTEASPDMVLAFAALTARASDDPGLRAACRNSLLRFEEAIKDVLHKEYPRADLAAIANAAHGIGALYLNVASLAPLEMPSSWTQSARSLAHSLLQGLDAKT